MDEKTPSALAKRLAAYSATASLALAVATGADAQVVYHDLDPNLTLEGTLPPVTLDLDLDDDGVVDFELLACAGQGNSACTYTYNRNRYYYQRRFALRVPSSGDPLNGVLGYDAPGISPPTGCASRLSTGAVVGPAGPDRGFYAYGLAASLSYSYGPFCSNFNGREGYAGFRFVAADGELHYGWIRLSATPDLFSGTAYEYAYEAAPEVPITVGALSAVVLTGAVNQTAFPPEGGTLRYTFTAENVTNAPLPLDLWIDFGRTGGLRVRPLGSGTLPPLARVTRTVSVGVPAGAPAGAYDVRFRVGDFASGRFLTFQRFEISKEGAAEGAEAFTVARFEGDLFAEAAAALPGTHALSAPSPNPTTGETSFTLSVAEAQEVTVAVYDALGRQVAVLYDGVLAAGIEHRLAFDGSDLPAGVYVVRAVGEAFADARVLTLTR